MAEDTAAAGELVKQNGWRQGSFIALDALKDRVSTPLKNDFDENLACVVLSHDCDVSHPSFDAEPFVEVLVGRIVDKEKKHIYYGRSTRSIQFPAVASGSEVLIEFSVHDIVQIPREHFQELQPVQDSFLKEDGVRELALWYARRYTRFGFPDALINRLKKAEKKVREKLKKKQDLLSGLYILTQNEELAEDESYQLVVWGVVKKSIYESSELRKQAQETLNLIEMKFSECDGIVVNEADLRSEEEVTLHDLRSMNRWDFDDLSVRSGELTDIEPK